VRNEKKKPRAKIPIEGRLCVAEAAQVGCPVGVVTRIKLGCEKRIKEGWLKGQGGKESASGPEV
jgi:hypothetical protein